MGIKVVCPNGHKLNVKTFLAGKKGVCPHCGAKFRIPEAEEDSDDSGMDLSDPAIPRPDEAEPAPLAAGPTQPLMPVPAAPVQPLPAQPTAPQAAPFPVAQPNALQGVASGAQPVYPAGMPAPGTPLQAMPVQAMPLQPGMARPMAVPMGGAPMASMPRPMSPGGMPMAVPVGGVPVGMPVGAPVAGPITMHPGMPAMPVAGAVPVAPRPAGDPIGEAPQAAWYVRPPAGGQYGPARGDVMRGWIAEGRVSADSLVWREGFADWIPAAQLFPSLAAATAPTPPAEPAAPAAGARSTRKLKQYESRKKGMGVVAIIAIVFLAIAALALAIVLAVVLSGAYNPAT